MRIERRAARAMLVVHGELCGEEARALPREVGALLAAGAPEGDVVLDFADVPSMDSAAFSAWVEAERLVLARGRRLLVRGAVPLVRDLFRLADLAEVLVP